MNLMDIFVTKNLAQSTLRQDLHIPTFVDHLKTFMY